MTHEMNPSYLIDHPVDINYSSQLELEENSVRRPADAEVIQV